MFNDLLTAAELDTLRSLIDGAQSVVLCCHIRPDGDAIGSCLGMAEYLRSIGKEATVVIPDQYPDFLMWLPNTEKIVRYDKRKAEADALFAKASLVVCLDFNSPQRVDAMAEALTGSPAPKLLIDHHLDPDMPGCALTVSRPEMCSTCEIVFRLVWQLGGFKAMGKQFAVPIYCGMMTDTGGFTYNSSRPEIYLAISQLLTKGIDKDRIYRNVFNSYSEWRMRLMGCVLYEKLVVDNERHAAFFTLAKDDYARFHFTKGDAEGLVNLPLQIKGMRLSISLREDREREKLVWVSLRSVDDFPCNKMAEMFFNGGGHLNASGGRLNCSLDEAVAVVKKAIAHFEPQLRQ